MNEQSGCLSTIIGYLIVAVGVLLGIVAILGTFDVGPGVGPVIGVLVCVVAGIIAIVALSRAAIRWRNELRFLREAPSQILSRMEKVQEGLAAGAGHLETAGRELEAATAPLFWDAMDDFVPAMAYCRAYWNEAVDIAERYDAVAARLSRVEEDGAPKLDTDLLGPIADMGEKWWSLRRLALGNEHFASIFEQRRQADKIADRLKQQSEEIQAAADAARRAERTALHAAAVAGEATAKARKADAKARRAGSTARRAAATARSAESIARWSKI